MLFDVLEPIHKLGPAELDLLCCAALLHDIGISVSCARHHKHSARLIRQSSLPALTADEREKVACIARYHRKAVPKPKHQDFAALGEADRQRVRSLSAILRLADGLDRAHENAVERLDAHRDSPVQWTVWVAGPGDLAYAAWGAERKAELFRDVFGLTVRFDPVGFAG